MSNKDTLVQTLTGVADYIRSKNGSTAKYKHYQLREELNKLPSANEIENTLRSIVDGSATTIQIPAGTTKIKDYFCYGSSTTHSNVTNVILPESVNEIGKQAFYYATNLRSINLDNVKILNESCFENCINLEFNELHLDNFTSISKKAFTSVNISKIYVPKNIKEIFSSSSESDYLFEYQKNPLQYYIEMTIDEWATYGKRFVGNQSINCLYFLDNNNNYYLLEHITIPTSITEIPKYLYFGFSKVKTITIPSHITKLNEYSFQLCNSIEEIIIEGNTTLENYSLYPGSLEGTYTIIMKSPTPPTLKSYAFYSNKLNKIYVPKGSRSTYIAATNWSSLASKIVEPNDVVLNVPESILNNASYTYSLDQGSTWNQFTSTSISLTEINTIRFKNTDANTTLLIGTTSGGSDIGTIANAELVAATTGDMSIYITIQ